MDVSLRQDNGGIGAEADAAGARHALDGLGPGRRREGGPVPEERTISAVVAVETHPPDAWTRKADRVGRVSAISEVQQDDHVVARPALIPAMEGYHLVVISHLKHVDVLAA